VIARGHRLRSRSVSAAASKRHKADPAILIDEKYRVVPTRMRWVPAIGSVISSAYHLVGCPRVEIRPGEQRRIPRGQSRASRDFHFGCAYRFRRPISHYRMNGISVVCVHVRTKTCKAAASPLLLLTAHFGERPARPIDPGSGGTAGMEMPAGWHCVCDARRKCAAALSFPGAPAIIFALWVSGDGGGSCGASLRPNLGSIGD